MTEATDTSRWALCIHRVTAVSAEVWVGTLFPSMAMPERARIRVTDASGRIRTSNIAGAQWQRPFSKLKQRFFVVRLFDKLAPNARYTVSFERQAWLGGKLTWQVLRTGVIETLPQSLPAAGERPFCVALASCFYDHRDGGDAAEAFKLLFEHGDVGTRPHLKFLTGDQVYLDIGFDSLSPVTAELRERIADDYAKHWQSLGSILSRGGTWMLPDDHEYWNDYPFFDSLVPTLFMLKVAAVRKAWTEAARDGVKNVQRSGVVETFSIGGELSFCIADLRSYRGVHRGQKVMLHPDVFPQLVEWAAHLQCPGVLVASQPLIVEKSDERNLLSFPAQYTQLLAALGQSGHDVVLLSGDVHYGRIAQSGLGPKGGRLFEVIASPLSNLTGINSISTSGAQLRPKSFPDSSIHVPGWARQAVAYDPAFAVQSLGGSVLSPYIKTRTKEHFMTASFSRAPGNRVALSVQCWHVRERQSPGGLPVPGFARAFTAALR